MFWPGPVSIHQSPVRSRLATYNLLSRPSLYWTGCSTRKSPIEIMWSFSQAASVHCFYLVAISHKEVTRQKPGKFWGNWNFFVSFLFANKSYFSRRVFLHFIPGQTLCRNSERAQALYSYPGVSCEYEFLWFIDRDAGISRWCPVPGTWDY